ncbi:MAG TPA: GAF domain-containing protein, partial [Nitrospira sp.]|nr:GAF domain-containing protein [Nitrospira sp.]
PGVAGTWKDLTDSVNAMASNLTVQLRDMSNVATSIANGDLTRQITVDVRGEILQIKDVINRMVAQLSAFASEVTRVAREVGTEGKLGGQAIVPGVPGTWKDLTESVNLLAANLTTQVRAIAEVATAVTQGDLTRSIQVQARGEVAELKDNINVMIRTLRATTDQNTEQDWLKTNLAKFTRMMQGQRDLTTVGDLLLSELAPLVNAQYGAIYQRDTADKPLLRLLASYAGADETVVSDDMRIGGGLVAQCAREKRRIVLTDVPSDYIRIRSGLGQARARNVIVLPVLFEGQTKAVIELATLSEFTPTHVAFLGQLTETIGVVVNTIEATMQTEGLLQQSQNLATELQAQQKELQQTNEELAKKAQQLAEQNAEVERKNREIEQARHALEDKARELALASKYKSEFLANMSHELRTPLNSILILAQQLSENPDQNLSSKQVEFSKNIHAAGADLLNLISDILDLSKIESGTVTVEPEEVLFMKVREATERSFRHVAEARQLAFHIEIDPQLSRSMVTDFKRLQQVLKNLLSNAFKFTSHGQVTFRIRRAVTGWS